MDEVEVTRNGKTDQFSITLVRGADTIRCMVSVESGGRADGRSDDEKHRAALAKAQSLAKALDLAIETMPSPAPTIDRSQLGRGDQSNDKQT